MSTIFSIFVFILRFEVYLSIFVESLFYVKVLFEDKVNYEEFERKILKIVYEDNIFEIRPSEIAFSFDLTIECAHQHLQNAVQNGVLSFGQVGGADIYLFEPEVNYLVPPDTAESTLDGADGSVTGHSSVDMKGADGTLKKKSVVISRASVSAPQHSPVQSLSQPQVLAPAREMILFEDDRQLEPREELMFSNASRTMFSRKILIKDTQIDKDELVTRVTNLFRSFGYRYVERDETTVRFERGSVGFLIALIPLFVLILPMFIYLLLSVLGRSTIQKEPILLDVKFERKAPYWEIDLTFLGLHGVVLGSADQSVLNREIDTLRDELKYAFHG